MTRSRTRSCDAAYAAPHPQHGETPSTELRQTVYLHPGQIFATGESISLMTVLGSCVAVCLWDETTKAGGMCHFVSPCGGGTGSSAMRYGSIAVPELIRLLKGLGSDPNTVEAKIFGGACVLEALKSQHRRLGVKNVATARTLLSEFQVPVSAEDVGGSSGRKVIFDLRDGSVWIKHLGRGKAQ